MQPSESGFSLHTGTLSEIIKSLAKAISGVTVAIEFAQAVTIMKRRQVETKSNFSRHIYRLECLRIVEYGPEGAIIVETFEAEVNFEAGIVVRIDSQSRQVAKELLGGIDQTRVKASRQSFHEFANRFNW